ncbi:type II toxin-antitoxin system ParD family antitoxin [Colwellia sp. E150_009]|jgi:antitoxin ParD1/3/4
MRSISPCGTEPLSIPLRFNHINISAIKNYLMANFANICQNNLIVTEEYIGVTMATLNISIPNEMRHWIDQQVTSGHFANASDYIRDLIRHNQSEKEAIRMALVEGEMSGESPLTVADIINQQRKNIEND